MAPLLWSGVQLYYPVTGFFYLVLSPTKQCFGRFYPDLTCHCLGVLPKSPFAAFPILKSVRQLDFLWVRICNTIFYFFIFYFTPNLVVAFLLIYHFFINQSFTQSTHSFFVPVPFHFRSAFVLYRLSNNNGVLFMIFLHCQWVFSTACQILIECLMHA